jgi:hypothetical protein
MMDFEKLSDDENYYVRSEVASNPNCPEWVKSKLEMVETFS